MWKSGEAEYCFLIEIRKYGDTTVDQILQDRTQQIETTISKILDWKQNIKALKIENKNYKIVDQYINRKDRKLQYPKLFYRKQIPRYRPKLNCIKSVIFIVFGF